MEISVVKDEKNEMEFMIDNVTVAEILRVYLNNGEIDFSAWRREHPSKPALFRVEDSKNVRKAISDAVSAIQKDLENLEKEIKKK